MMPWSDAWGDAPEGSADSDLIELVQGQVKNTKLESPDTPMGDRLLAYEVTQHGMAFKHFGKIGAFDIPYKKGITLSQEDFRPLEDGKADKALLDSVKCEKK